jgi:hypothetical protein
MSAVLTRLREIREGHTRRRNLWRELSVYVTDNELNDIEAAISRSDDAESSRETQEIRRILAAKRNLSYRA